MNKKAIRVALAAGARPNFMKIAPIEAVLKRTPDEFETLLVHTGQHYDHNMSAVFFRDLGLRAPDLHLDVGSGSHAQQTAEVMKRFERVLLAHTPDWVIVVGDVNSTLACALTAAKLCIPVAHVEAGLRSNDRTMPEEVNRVVTDRLADLLLTPSRDASMNLEREGIPTDNIVFVGNVMIDSLRKAEGAAIHSAVLQDIGVQPRKYCLVTLHRPSNVDAPEDLAHIVAALNRLQQRLPIVFPAHPRTRKALSELARKGGLHAAVRLIDPVGYIDCVALQMNAAFVITDSGGVQEETTALGVPCLTARENTERPITVTEGTNTVVGRSQARIVAESERILAGNGKSGTIPEGWDGRASERIVAALRAAASTPGRRNAPSWGMAASRRS